MAAIPSHRDFYLVARATAERVRAALQSCSLMSLLAQVETNLKTIDKSGISDVSTGEWVLGVAVFVASLIVAVVARRLVERVMSRSGSPSITHLAGSTAAFLIVVLGFFYALSSVDVSVGPLIGGLGIADRRIAVAFALQEILGNFAAGVLLQLRRPIRIGDQIVSNEYEGLVRDVNFRSVRLRTFDGETVYLPNSMVLQNPIINWTKTPTRRTSLIVGVAYDTDLGLAQRTMIGAVEGLEGIEGPPHEVEAFAYEFGDSSINFEVRFWHKAEIKEMWEARDRATQAIKIALDEAAITIPFPQTTLWFGPGGTELRTRSLADPDAAAG